MDKVYLLLPKQSSIYSAIYDVYNDLYLGLKSINTHSKIILLNLDERNAPFPYFKTEEYSARDIPSILDSEGFFLTIDDFSLLKSLYKYGVGRKLLIWAHIFYGHRFLFRRYVDLPRRNFGQRDVTFIANLLPSFLLHWKARFYIETLNRNRVIAQSLWTDLLLERVYNIKTEGVLYIPIEPTYYDVKVEKTNSLLIYFGNIIDTDLIALKNVLDELTKTNSNIKLDYFGDKNIGEFFSRKYGFNLNYLGKLDRKKLSEEYARHTATIAPVYNGNFEMVPIQSLLSGTPVISFIQPFMEVTGRSEVVANISNVHEVKTKYKYWSYSSSESIQRIKDKILSVMLNTKVADELMRKYFLDLNSQI